MLLPAQSKQAQPPTSALSLLIISRHIFPAKIPEKKGGTERTIAAQRAFLERSERESERTSTRDQKKASTIEDVWLG